MSEGVAVLPALLTEPRHPLMDFIFVLVSMIWICHPLLSSQLVNCDYHSMIQFSLYQGSPYWLYMYTISKCQYHTSFNPDSTLRHLKFFKLNSVNCCQFTNWKNLLATLEMQTLWWIVAHLRRALNLLGLEVLCSSQYECLCAFTGYSWWCASVVSNVDSRY